MEQEIVFSHHHLIVKRAVKQVIVQPALGPDEPGPVRHPVIDVLGKCGRPGLEVCPVWHRKLRQHAVFIILITQMSLHCLPGWIRQKQQGHKQNDQSDLLLLHKYFSSSPAAHSAGAVFCFLCLLIR